MDLHEVVFGREVNPVDKVEQVASGNDWAFSRDGDDEISISVTGNWAEYLISYSWMEEFEALHLACSFDLKIPNERGNEATRLLSMINGQLLIGHFDFSLNDGWVMYRQTLLLNGGAEPTGQQLECQLSSGLEASERYYQAFQLVVWAGYSAKDALDSALFETAGNA
ncbi:MAG: hypothetical protein GY742_08590 [Hyphomicrobiales bacterium]|nr:hypothetical protein [Hyphomicrobiales bacterium]